MKFLIFLLNIPFFLIPHSYENIVHLHRKRKDSFQAILSALWNTKCFVTNKKYLNNSTFVNDKEMNYWYKNLKKSFFFKPIIYELNHYRICIFYRNNLRIFFPWRIVKKSVSLLALSDPWIKIRGWPRETVPKVRWTRFLARSTTKFHSFIPGWITHDALNYGDVPSS